MAILEINNLSKSYGNSRGIVDIDLKIEPGEILGFIGPNGAGKSTTIRCIMNQLNKNSGEILFNNKPLLKNDIESYTQIGYLPSETHLYSDMTGEELINFNASFYKYETKTKAYELAKKLNFDVKRKFNELSLGNAKKLGIILALMHSPKLIIMDEATSGLDPLIQDTFYKIIKQEKNNGTSFLFSSHNLREIKKLCDKVVIIKEGKVIQNKSIQDIIGHNAVKVYFESNDTIDKELGYTKNKNAYTKMFEGDYNKLLNELSTINITRLNIEEAEFEEIFMFYYK